MVIETIIILR